ncbi:MAG: hypothetical protein HOV83_24025 [Catenulispora sp.]|nr:hypothetical protein [Catenulispora sp.]
MAGIQPPSVRLVTQASLETYLAGVATFAYDTDGIPVLTNQAGLLGSPVAFDTDNIPYVVKG